MCIYVYIYIYIYICIYVCGIAVFVGFMSSLLMMSSLYCSAMPLIMFRQFALASGSLASNNINAVIH